MIRPDYLAFIKESNAIEGIFRDPTKKEIAEFERFLALDTITIKDLKKFVSVYAPGNVIRNKSGLNVSIGGHYAPFGGKKIVDNLQEILEHLATEGPYKTHVAYELLHPFTDGNGRSGRMLWVWQMTKNNHGEFPRLRFLHAFYYQALNYARS